MVDCMREIPADVLVDAQNELQVWLNFPTLFGPVVEKSSNVDPFHKDLPSRIMKEGRGYDVPWVTGIVADEGLVFSAGYMQNDTLRYVDENWDSLAPVILDYTYTIPKEQHADIAERVRKHYLGEKPINRENLIAFTNLMGDRMFGVGVINAAKAQAAANKSPVFFYYYSYGANDSLSDESSNSKENFGVAHGDDVHLVIADPRITPTKSTMDMDMQRRLIQIWTSVAYNGIPDIGIKWPNVQNNNTNSLDYLVIAGPNDLKTGYSDNLVENKFWNSIGFNEN